MKLNNLDKRIIRALGNDARLSYAALAKKLHSKKEVVAYHVKKLEKYGVIKKYVPVFSQARLGISVYKIYVRFQGLSSKEEQAMIQKFMKSPYVNWMAKSTGTWDLMLAFYCKNILEFAEKRRDVLFKPYGKFIQEYTISVLEDALIYTRDYLTSTSTRERPGFVYGGSLTQEKLSKHQKEIIQLIRNNGRYEVVDIARKLKLNVKTVMAKIKDLEKRGIVQGYITIIDQEKLGVHYFKLDISFQDHSDVQYKKVLQYCKNNQYVVNLMTSVGDWEIELEAEAESLEDIYNLSKDLRRKFPTIIKKVDLHIINEEVKVDYLPEWF